MKLVDDWLKGGQNYAVGVRILLQHTADKTLVRLFTSEGETPFKRQKLLEAMKALGGDTPKTTHQPNRVPSPLSPGRWAGGEARGQGAEAPTQETFPLIWPSTRNKDATLQQLWERARLLLKEIASIHSSLPHLTPQKRHAAAMALLRKDEELDEVYAQRDFYEANGAMPPSAGTEPLLEDPFLMGARLANLRRYIRRERQAARQQPDNTIIMERLQRYTTEYNAYMKKLGKPELQ